MTLCWGQSPCDDSTTALAEAEGTHLGPAPVPALPCEGSPGSPRAGDSLLWLIFGVPGHVSCPSQPRSVLQREGFDLGHKVRPGSRQVLHPGRVATVSYSGEFLLVGRAHRPVKVPDPIPNLETETNQSASQHQGARHRRQTGFRYRKQGLNHGSKWQGHTGHRAG